VSRLALAKHALHLALEDLPCGSKVGWAIFTEYRSYLLFTPVEVCDNRAELRASLAGIDGRMAWSGNSEVAKALHSGITVVKALPGVPSLVFITDGHEAPPLNARHRPKFDDKAGEVAGLIVGVGDLKPTPIPKTDPMGRPLGFWHADEVAAGRPAQPGPRRQRRPGEDVRRRFGVADAAVGLGATPGSEHLSGLRETYLRLLAQENGFAFHKLRSAAALSKALRDQALSRPVRVSGDARVLLAALAFGLLLVPYLTALWAARRSRRLAAAAGG
jgi:mxaL protein